MGGVVFIRLGHQISIGGEVVEGGRNKWRFADNVWGVTWKILIQKI